MIKRRPSFKPGILYFFAHSATRSAAGAKNGRFLTLGSFGTVKDIQVAANTNPATNVTTVDVSTILSISSKKSILILCTGIKVIKNALTANMRGK